MIKKYLIYLLRWQLSTPILAICVYLLNPFGSIISTIIANLVGGLMFFWIDRYIFDRFKKITGSLWEIKEAVVCWDCGKVGRGYRLVKNKDQNYDRFDAIPEFRCKACAERKLFKMRK